MVTTATSTGSKVELDDEQAISQNRGKSGECDFANGSTIKPGEDPTHVFADAVTFTVCWYLKTTTETSVFTHDDHTLRCLGLFEQLLSDSIYAILTKPFGNEGSTIRRNRR